VKKKSSSGTPAGTLLQQRYSEDQRYSVGKESSRGTPVGTLLQQRYSEDQRYSVGKEKRQRYPRRDPVATEVL